MPLISKIGEIKMKIWISCFIFFLSFNASALDGEDILEISTQFQNRNWNYHSMLYSRRAHLASYENSSYLTQAISYMSYFINKLDSLNDDSSSGFFPEANISSESDRIVVKDQFKDVLANYNLLANWSDFLSVLGEENWEDTDSVACAALSDPINETGNENCGRKTKGNYLIANLTYDQRESLNSFREVVLKDLDVINSEELALPVGPGIARVFQLFLDERAVDRLLNQGYLKNADQTDPEKKKKNTIAILRSILIQLFLDSNGDMINSDLKDIKLEEASCLALATPTLQNDCQLSYVRNLFADIDASSSGQITNLILDPKISKPLSISFQKGVESIEDVDDVILQNKLKQYYFALVEGFGIDSENPTYDSEFLAALETQLQRTSESLLYSGDLNSLKLARGLHNTIIFLRSL